MAKFKNPSPKGEDNFEVEQGQDQDIAKLLRQSAPALPVGLKSRTLTECALRTQAQKRRQKRLQWQLTWAFVGILTVQGMTLFFVDAQTNRLIAGNSPSAPLSSVSFAQVSELWHRRSQQLAQLMEPSNQPSKEPFKTG